MQLLNLLKTKSIYLSKLTQGQSHLRILLNSTLLIKMNKYSPDPVQYLAARHYAVPCLGYVKSTKYLPQHEGVLYVISL